MSSRLHVVVLVVGVSLTACGEAPRIPTAPAPSTVTGPPPPGPAGSSERWSGTFETSSWDAFVPFRVVVHLNEENGAISGNWTDVSYMDFGGQISGNVERSADGWSFAGVMTIVGARFPACEGSFSGTGSSVSQVWSIPEFGGDCDLYGLKTPRDVRFILQRDAQR